MKVHIPTDPARSKQYAGSEEIPIGGVIALKVAGLVYLEGVLMGGYQARALKLTDEAMTALASAWLAEKGFLVWALAPENSHA